MFRKAWMAAVLGALVMLGGAGAAHAESRESCYRRVRNEQRDLDRAIQRHGYRSRQAEKERRELARAQERCDRQFGRFRDRDRDRDRDYRWH